MSDNLYVTLMDIRYNITTDDKMLHTHTSSGKKKCTDLPIVLVYHKTL